MKFFVSIEIGAEVLLARLEVFSYKLNSFVPNEIENITFDVLMPHTKSITNGVICRPQIRLNFLIHFGDCLSKLKPAYCEIYSPGDSTLIFLKTENMFSIIPPVITKIWIHAQKKVP